MSAHFDRPASPFVLNKIFDFEDQKSKKKYLFEKKLYNSNTILQYLVIKQQDKNRSNLNCLNEKELISQIIKESNFNKNSTTNYSIKSAQLVRNQTLERNYMFILKLKVN